MCLLLRSAGSLDAPRIPALCPLGAGRRRAGRRRSHAPQGTWCYAAGGACPRGAGDQSGGFPLPGSEEEVRAVSCWLEEGVQPRRGRWWGSLTACGCPRHPSPPRDQQPARGRVQSLLMHFQGHCEPSGKGGAADRGLQPQKPNRLPLGSRPTELRRRGRCFKLTRRWPLFYPVIETASSTCTENRMEAYSLSLAFTQRRRPGFLSA